MFSATDAQANSSERRSKPRLTAQMACVSGLVGMLGCLVVFGWEVFVGGNPAHEGWLIHLAGWLSLFCFCLNLVGILVGVIAFIVSRVFNSADVGARRRALVGTVAGLIGVWLYWRAFLINW